MNELSPRLSPPPPVGFSNRVREFLARVQYARANSPQELDAIYRLRYDANLREGAIEANAEERLSDRFDHTSNVHNFAIFIDDVLTSALRIHVVTAREPISPALEAFRDLLEDQVNANVTVIDGNRFVANYPRARAFPHLPYITLRLGILAAEHFGADIITASVRTEHVAFYQREYFATKMCEPRPYPTLVKPLSLISINFKRDRDDIIARHPFYESNFEERQNLFCGSVS
jgi:hypothetical protein